MSDLLKRFTNVRSKLDRQLGEIKALKARSESLNKERENLISNIDLHSKSLIILNSIADSRQTNIYNQIESLVTEGLRSIFGEELSFHLVPAIKANRQVLSMSIRSTLPNGNVFDTDIKSARGGGHAAVVGFLLRLVILLLTKRDKPKLLVLDETFAQVSEEYRPAVATFIRQIVDKTDTQVILISHFHDLADTADKVYNFTLSRTGETVVKEIR